MRRLPYDSSIRCVSAPGLLDLCFANACFFFIRNYDTHTKAEQSCRALLREKQPSSWLRGARCECVRGKEIRGPHGRIRSLYNLCLAHVHTGEARNTT